MKKYRELLPVCFIFFYGFSPLSSMGYTNVLNKNETGFKSHFNNRPLFPSESQTAQKEKSQGWERGSPNFLKRKSGTKFKDYDNYGELSSGYILLTDHSDKVYFRNIKIKRL